LRSQKIASRSRSHEAYCFIASGRVAEARGLFGIQFVLVVGSDLFAGNNLSEGVDEDPLAGDDRIRVGLTRMIDVLGTVATSVAINGPFSVNIADTSLATGLPSPLSFSQ
jgi:hypothetical protein